jgi:hypothetical protein
VLAFSGLGDVCDTSDTANYDPTACAAAGGTVYTSGASVATEPSGGSLTTSGAQPQFNYSGWSPSQCANLPSQDQQTLCNYQSGNAAAQAGVQRQTTASAGTLPPNVSPSSVPNLPGMPPPGSQSQAINWWTIGIGAVAGLITGIGLALFLSRRSA